MSILLGLFGTIFVILLLAYSTGRTLRQALASARPVPWLRAIADAEVDRTWSKFFAEGAFALLGVIAGALLMGVVTALEALVCLITGEPRRGVPDMAAFFPVALFFIFLLRPRLRAGLLRRAIRNSALVFGDVALETPFALYLRDHREEGRTIVGGAPGQETVSHLHLVASLLSRALPDATIYGLWHPNDDRENVLFEPLLTDEADWHARVAQLCARASVIIVDVANESKGLLWELSLLGETPELLDKTLAIRAATDPPLSESAARTIASARWQALIAGRTGEAKNKPLELAPDLRARLGCAVESPGKRRRAH